MKTVIIATLGLMLVPGLGYAADSKKAPMKGFVGDLEAMTKTNSDYRRVVTTGDIIAGFRVAEIDTSAVKLERDAEELELEVGQGMSRVGEGDWAPTAADQITEFQEDPRPGGGMEPERNVAPSPGGTQEDDNDVLRRMRVDG